VDYSQITSHEEKQGIITDHFLKINTEGSLESNDSSWLTSRSWLTRVHMHPLFEIHIKHIYKCLKRQIKMSRVYLDMLHSYKVVSAKTDTVSYVKKTNFLC
jgi:hypothetical protein